MATYKELMQVCDYLDDIEGGIDIKNLILNYEINKYYKNKYLKVTILIRNTKNLKNIDLSIL